MRFAEFYILSTGYVAGSNPPRFDGPCTPVPACGSDAIMRIDGRHGDARAVSEARTACKAGGFIGFTLNAGRTFSDSRITRPLELI